MVACFKVLELIEFDGDVRWREWRREF